MSTSRLNIRIPEEYRARLEKKARNAGYPSACALARTVLVQFLRHSVPDTPDGGHTGWIESLIYGEADREDPTQRQRINERI